MKLVFNFKIIALFVALFLVIFVLIYFLKFLDDNSVQIYDPPPKRDNNKLNRVIQMHFPPNRSVLNITQRIVHLDLKGAPPKLSYYTELFPLFHNLGATGILMEYEDMFPYEGPLSNISALNAYTLLDVKEINNLAKQNELKVIPFIPLFGHMDFLLKLEDFIEYREVRQFPSVICPSYNKTLKLLETLIDQVLDAHLDSEMIHIGCNAVPHLGNCDRCSNRMLTEELTKSQLFMAHIRSLTAMIKRKRPSMNVLLWDDYFRTIDPDETLQDSQSASFQPVVWWYGKDVYDELGPSLWNMYSELFPSVWLASAYKGAIVGSFKYISDANHYIQNHKSWLSVIDEYSSKMQFNGIILTGWQRYDHFSVLCELLPIGIPSLAMSLRLLQGYSDPALGPPLEVAKMLQCEQPYGLIGTAFGSPKCKFPGGDILEYIIHFHQLDQEFSELLEDPRVKGWLSEYNRDNAFSNPKVVKAALMSIGTIKIELELVKSRISDSMLRIYDSYTVQEWLATYLEPFEKKLYYEEFNRCPSLDRVIWVRKPPEAISTFIQPLPGQKGRTNDIRTRRLKSALGGVKSAESSKPVDILPSAKDNSLARLMQNEGRRKRRLKEGSWKRVPTRTSSEPNLKSPRVRGRIRSKRRKHHARFGYDIENLDEFLSKATLSRPANIPVVLAFPSVLYQTRIAGYHTQVALPLGMVVNAIFRNQNWLYVQTPHAEEGYISYSACLPLGIIPPPQDDKSSPCWERSTDIFPKPSGNMTDTEKMSCKSETEDDSYCPRMRYRTALSTCGEKSVDRLYLRAAAIAKGGGSRHTLLVINEDYKGDGEKTLGVCRNDVVFLLDASMKGWFYVKNKAGLEGYIPSAIAGHGFL